MNILLAYDGSNSSKLAIAELVNVGIPPESTIHVLSIGELNVAIERSLAMGMGEFPYGNDTLSSILGQATQSTEQLASEAKREIERLLPNVKVSSDSLLGSPSKEIIQRAKLLNIDLIILGSHGRSFVFRLFLGSVSLDVLHSASRSVRIVRSASKTPLKILLAVDGSRDSNKMLDTVLSRRWVVQPEFELMYVDDLTVLVSIHGVGFELLDDESSKESDRVLLEAQAKLETQGIKAKVTKRIGTPVGAIIEEARMNDISVIYMGAQGHGLMERTFLGSVSHGVASRFSGSIEVIR